ncbi:MAG: hypothetical protein KBA46_07630 [Candidatus Omnitrophica bacterium]|nr:hypothetical protein [Candidatus Omnitrophota bacterium]
MRRKALLLIFLLFALAILVSVWLVLISIHVDPSILEEVRNPSLQEKHELVIPSLKSINDRTRRPLFGQKITVVGKKEVQSTKVPLADEADNVLKNARPQLPVVLSGDIVDDASGFGKDEVTDIESDVTQLNKYPRQEEVQEMNAKGIMLY